MIFFNSGVLVIFKQAGEEFSTYLKSMSSLLSYAYIKNDKNLLKYTKEVKKYLQYSMLDSGAFSAYKLNEEIYLKDYMVFLKTHKDIFDFYISLDVMNDPRKSFENYKEMKKNGFEPLSVFQIGGKLKDFIAYIEAGAKYICIGGIAIAKASSIHYHMSKIDIIFEYLKKNNLLNEVKYTGLELGKIII